METDLISILIHLCQNRFSEEMLLGMCPNNLLFDRDLHNQLSNLDVYLSLSDLTLFTELLKYILLERKTSYFHVSQLYTDLPTKQSKCTVLNLNNDNEHCVDA